MDGTRKQTAYEVEAWKNAEKDWCSGKVFSASMRCRYEGDVSSRDRITWKVRLYDEERQDGGCKYKVWIPGNCKGVLCLPDGREKVLLPGENHYFDDRDVTRCNDDML